jgi:hypothetical protein
VRTGFALALQESQSPCTGLDWIRTLNPVQSSPTRSLVITGALSTLPKLRFRNIALTTRNKAAVLTLRRPRQQSEQSYISHFYQTVQTLRRDEKTVTVLWLPASEECKLVRLDAQGCTCPTGQLWSRVYDDRENEYKVPEWLVLEPTGLVEEEDLPATEDKNDGAVAIDESEPGREFVVRVRISETSMDLKVTVRKRETVASIREKLKTLAQVRQKVQQRDFSALSIGAYIKCADQNSWPMARSSCSSITDMCMTTTTPSKATATGTLTTTKFSRVSSGPRNEA